MITLQSVSKAFRPAGGGPPNQVLQNVSFHVPKSCLYGLIGYAFFVYGRKQQAPVPLLCGIVLMIFPYFIANTIALILIGLTLIALPYFVRV